MKTAKAVKVQMISKAEIRHLQKQMAGLFKHADSRLQEISEHCKAKKPK